MSSVLVASQSSCFFLCSREQIRQVENRLNREFKFDFQYQYQQQVMRMRCAAKSQRRNVLEVTTTEVRAILVVVGIERQT